MIDASGTWSQPNPIGAGGLPALHESRFTAQIVYGMPDVLGSQRGRYADKRVLVVGAGHSAAGSLIALAQLAESAPHTQLVWAIRGDNLARIFGGGNQDGLPARGELGQRLKALHDSGRLELHTGFRIHSLQPGKSDMDVVSEDGQVIPAIAEIIAATGARPDLGTTRELRVKLDPWLESTELLAPLIDPNEHSCGTVHPHGHRELAHPETGYFAVGARSYGRAPNFLLATGYEQVRSVVASLAGDSIAADDVQLDLPKTGVCSVSFVPAESSDGPTTSCCGDSPAPAKTVEHTEPSTCCGGTAPADSGACCVKDAEAKAEGKVGCECGPKPVNAEKEAVATLDIEVANRPARACC